MTVVNKLKQQVDLPVWEWTRAAPVASAVTTCSCTPDNQSFNANAGRFIYYNINSTNFWRYDTVADSWMQLASPPQAVATGASMRYAGAAGYYGRVISATGSTITTGLPFGGTAVGFKIRIISGTGAGQERIITSVADPVVADFGSASSGQALGTTAFLADTNKTWGSYNGSNVWCVNNWVGYNLRTLIGTGVFQSRKILYNSATSLFIGDTGLNASDPWADVQCVAPAAGTQYQIESSVITVDTAWGVTPDITSRYVIQSGGIYLLSSAAATPFYTLQYYDVLADVWYTKSALTNMVNPVAGTDFVLERVTENSSVWFIETASGGTTGSGTSTLVDNSAATWTANQWANYYVFVYSGSGVGQWSKINSNTTTTLTLAANWSVATDATSRYEILGYDMGLSTSSAYNTLVDSGKSWTTNQWSNYAVRIIYGTGVGQVRSIASNTSTTLTLYQNWNIQPDSTSVYSLQGDTDSMYFILGGYSEVFIHRSGDIDMLSHGRVITSGITSIMTAYLSNSNHTIFEQAPFAITTITNSTTLATATTVFAHNLKPGQYVSIRGVTGADGQYYNGLFPIVSVAAQNTFTYTMSGTPSGSATGLGTLSSTLLYDASKQHQQAATGSNGAATIAAVSGNFPSNINGWWVTGSGIATAAQVLSGAGSGTLTLSTNNSGAVSGQIVFTAWAPTFTLTTNGGAINANTITFAASTPANINGWLVSGTGIGVNATSPCYVVSGQGTTTLTLSNPNTASVSGNVVTFGNNNTGLMLYVSTAVPTAVTGLAAGSSMQISANTGSSLTLPVALAASVANGVSRYVIAKRDMIGATLGGGQLLHPTYNSGISTAGAANSITDTTARWVSQTGCTGAQYGTTLTLPTPSPSYINGWYVSNGTGTGVQNGTRVVSGAGTVTITLSVALSAAASGTYNFDAWSSSELVNKRIKILSATGVTVETTITAYAPATQVMTITGTPGASSAYAIMSTPVRAPSPCLIWASNFVGTTTRGQYLYSFRGGVVGLDRLDITTDAWTTIQYSPIAEALTTSSQYTYDGGSRLYFSVGFTQRIYYLDLNSNLVYGSGMYPYAAGTTMIGNRMEIFTTPDGLKYLWINRHANVECYRTLLFY